MENKPTQDYGSTWLESIIVDALSGFIVAPFIGIWILVAEITDKFSWRGTR